MKIIMSMYISLMPAIFAGIGNMIWCKTKFFPNLMKPIDNMKLYRDGHRILGDNKTWKGFIGYIILGIIMTSIWGYICSFFTYLEIHNYIYVSHPNTLLYNILIGFGIGFGYAICELPNSFLKRRLQITPGKTTTGLKKYLFIFLDQADSLFGCVFVVHVVYPMSISMYLGYVLLGAGTHIIINVGLFYLGLRKNIM